MACFRDLPWLAEEARGNRHRRPGRASLITPRISPRWSGCDACCATPPMCWPPTPTSSLFSCWPAGPKAPSRLQERRRLRQQAITQIQKAGGWRPSSASLLASEALLRTLIGHTDRICALAVLPDGRLASGSGDHTIKLWNPASGACVATFEGHSSSVNALAVLPDGRLASGSDDPTIKLWDPATRRAAPPPWKATPARCGPWRCSPTGASLRAQAMRTIKLWDPASGDPGSGELIFVADAAITALAAIPGALPPGASLLVAGDASGRLHWLRLG